MDALILCGSGNPNGHTARLCRRLMEKLDGSVTVITVKELDIGDCIGCGACKNGKGCILQDGMPYDLIDSADIVIFATPIHFNGCTSIMKRFIDRLNPYWFGKAAKTGAAYGILVGGGKKPVFSHALSELKSGNRVLSKEWIGECTVSDTDDTVPDIEAIVVKILSDLEVYRDRTCFDIP